MRRLLFFVVLVAVAALTGCARSAAGGPAWPEPSKTAEDGGESIEPHPSATYASVIERSAEPEQTEDKPSETAAAPAASTEDGKADPAAATSQPTSDDVMMTEEIIIEIDE